MDEVDLDILVLIELFSVNTSFSISTDTIAVHSGIAVYTRDKGRDV